MSAQSFDVARQTVAAGAKVLWLQVGITSDEAREIAKSGGTFLQESCIGVEARVHDIRKEKRS